MRSGSIAEHVRKDLESVLGVGPCRCYDVMLRIVIPGPTSGQTGMSARHSGPCQRQDRKAFPHFHQSKLFSEL